jgi:hypothetical protein
MPLDDRLRDALRDNANTFEPDTDAAWHQIQHRRRRPSIARAVVFAAAAAALVVGLVLIVRPGDEPAGPATSNTTPDTIESVHLTGHYRATLDPSADTDRYGVTGTWEVTLDPTGILDIRPPSTFSGIVDAQLYEADGILFRTDLFRTDLCSGLAVASYRWQIDERGALRFSVVDDDCPARVTFWTTTEWQPVP